MSNHTTDGRLLLAALGYAAHGWPVFPSKPKTKCPATRRGFKAASTDTTKIRRWWRDGPDKNVAIVTGQGSGIIVVDVDPRNGGNDTLAELEAEHGKLPATIEALTGGGGRHLYFKHPGGRIKSRANTLGAGLDVKADGGYIIAPPSVHECGKGYAWVASRDPAAIELAEPPTWLLEILRQEQKTEDCCNADSLCGCVSDSLCFCVSSVDEAISLTIPSGPGQRHRAVFNFVRMLKSLPDWADAGLPKLRPIAKRWFDVAKPHTSGEHDFTDTLADFATAWQNCKYSIGSGPMADALHEADQTALPKCALQYESERVQRLVGLCHELQRRAGDEPFFLASRTVAMLLGGSAKQAALYMNLLCMDGILERVTKGHRGRASEYRYLAGD